MRCRQQPLYSAVGRLPGGTTLWLQARAAGQRLGLSLVVRPLDDMEQLLIYGIPMLLTVPVAASLCRYRLHRRKRVSYGTMITAAFIVVLVFLVVASEGDCFSLVFWSSDYHRDFKWDPDWPLPMLRLIGFIATICTLPALAVVAYYQKRALRDAKHVA